MKARVLITLKSGVLDPQGKAVQKALGALGFDGVDRVRQGKVIEIDLVEADEQTARKKISDMCDKLLANTVIENYDIELLPDGA